MSWQRQECLHYTEANCDPHVVEKPHHSRSRSHRSRSVRSHLYVPIPNNLMLSPITQQLTIPSKVLNDWTALYLSAQTAGNPALLTNTLFPNLTYTEQFAPTNVSSGILSKPLNITQYRSIVDEYLCTAFTEIIVTNPSHPYVHLPKPPSPKSSS